MQTKRIQFSIPLPKNQFDNSTTRHTSLTIVFVNTLILLSLKVDSVYSINCLLNVGNTDGSASTNVIRTLPESSGYHALKSSSKKSCNSPLIVFRDLLKRNYSWDSPNFDTSRSTTYDNLTRLSINAAMSNALDAPSEVSDRFLSPIDRGRLPFLHLHAD